MLDVSSISMGDGIGIAKPLEQVLVSLGTQLKTLRSQRGWTLERLSKLTKLSEPYLSRLESGSRQPSLAALLTLRSEEHTSELQSHLNLVCRLLLEKKKIEYES